MKFYPWLVYQFSVGDPGFEQISSTDDSGTQVCHLVVLCFASCLRIFCILWENGWERRTHLGAVALIWLHYSAHIPLVIRPPLEAMGAGKCSLWQEPHPGTSLPSGMGA